MKNANRVRLNSKAAKVPAQTKTPSRKINYEKLSVELFVSDYYKRWRSEIYESAVCELDSLYCVIQHHPDLKRIASILKTLSDGERTLNHLCVWSREIKERSEPLKESCTILDQAAIHWLSNYYNQLRQVRFSEAIPQYSGLYAWIRNHPGTRFKQVAVAVHKIVCAFSLMNAFVEDVDAR